MQGEFQLVGLIGIADDCEANVTIGANAFLQHWERYTMRKSVDHKLRLSSLCAFLGCKMRIEESKCWNWWKDSKKRKPEGQYV